MRPGRLAVVIPAAVLLATFASGAIRLGSSGELAYRAAHEMATWGASGHEPGAASVEWLVADLERAGPSVPGDPNIQEMLGSLDMKRIDRPEFLDEALAHYRLAVALRPTSPYSWANLVTAEYRKGATGPEIEMPMRNAARLGPAEPEVQRTVIDYGLALWDEEQPDTRQAVERTITGAMKRDATEALQIAERRGRLAVACRHLADAPRRVDPKWGLLCRGREVQR